MTKLPEEIHLVDIHVGANVRLRRKAMKVSQSDLADALGVSFQQVQKYERGTNRISASRLYDIAACLGVNVEYFFRGLDVNKEPIAAEGEEIVQEFIRHPRIIRIATGFKNLNTANTSAIIGMIEHMGGKGE
jgi:transcriptional regulator with XRE-family HTH domain